MRVDCKSLAILMMAGSVDGGIVGIGTGVSILDVGNPGVVDEGVVKVAGLLVDAGR